MFSQHRLDCNPYRLLKKVDFSPAHSRRVKMCLFHKQGRRLTDAR